MRTIPIYPSRPISPSGMARSLAAPLLKGRGTAWALAHRFSSDERQSCDDGWGSLDQVVAEQSVAPATRVLEEQVKTILAGNDSPDIGFDLSINPYRGCEHVMWNSSSRSRQPRQTGRLRPRSFDL